VSFLILRCFLKMNGRLRGELLLMPTAEFLRLMAQECRELLAKATVPEVRAQLELWAREFEEEAAKLEAAAAEPG
jgi:hypothetical protein